MDLLHKKCEVCGTNISKIKKNWYRLVFLDVIKCPNCEKYYQSSGWLRFIFSFPTGIGLMTSLFFIIIFVIAIMDIEVVMGIKLTSLMIFTFAFIISFIIKLLVMLVVPLKLIEDKKDKKEN